MATAYTKPSGFLGTGRRKTSVAQVRLVPGSGKVIINNRTVDEYLTVPNQRTIAFQPLAETQNVDKFDVFISVDGGGVSGQAGAISHGFPGVLPGSEISDFDVRVPQQQSNQFLTRITAGSDNGCFCFFHGANTLNLRAKATSPEYETRGSCVQV